MTTQRRMSRIPEKVRHELVFVGQCIAAGGVLFALVNFAVSH